MWLRSKLQKICDINKTIFLRLAMTLARQKSHEYLTVEHLLLALLENNNAATTLKACGADIASLRSDLEAYIEKHTPTLDADLAQEDLCKVQTF